MSRKITVKEQMLYSFSLVIIFTLFVGYSGIRGIKSINYQNQIRSLISQGLTDIQEAQASSLRYVLYKEDHYIDEIEQFGDKAKSAILDAEGMTDSQEITEEANGIIQAISSYVELNESYQDLENEMSAISSLRADAAAIVLQQAESLKALEQRTAGSEGSSRSLRYEQLLSQVYRFHNYAYIYMLATTDDIRAAELNNWLDGVDASETMVSALYAEAVNAVIADSLNTALQQIRTYRGAVTDYVEIYQEQMALLPEMKAQAGIVMEKGDTIAQFVESAVNSLARRNMILTLGALGLAILFGVVISLIITKSLTRQLGGEPYEIEDITGRISRGDLDINFPDRKLTGVYLSMKDMTGQLRRIVNDITGAAEQVSRGSDQISSSAQEISSGTSEQASNMEEVSASIEQLNANIQQNTDNAQQSNVMARKVADDSRTGSQAVADTVNAMKNIAEKISVIQEIARSTNMLALNAAIEAARAGDAGKGFAVVASEVRKLAENSGAAAKEITEITEDSVKRAEEAQTLIEEFVPSMQKTADLVEEIAMASQEQNKGSIQINTAVVQLDTVIQQNASASEELASMSEELNSQAVTMKETIGFFSMQGKAKPARKAAEERNVSSVEREITYNLVEPDIPRPVIELPALEEQSVQNQSADYDSNFEEF